MARYMRGLYGILPGGTASMPKFRGDTPYLADGVRSSGFSKQRCSSFVSIEGVFCVNIWPTWKVMFVGS